MDWSCWIMIGVLSVTYAKEFDQTFLRNDFATASLRFPLATPNRIDQLPSVFRGLASTARAATDLHMGAAATNHSPRRVKRDHPLNKALFRDDEGVDVLSSLAWVAEVSGLVLAVLPVQSALLFASLQGDAVTIYELHLDSLQVSTIGTFSGGGMCGFSEADGRVLLVCGQPRSGDAGKVMVREVVQTGSRRGVRPLHPVFLNDVVATAAWQQDGSHYLLLAENEQSDSSALLRNSRRFLALKESSEQTCDGRIQLYRWTEHNYDPIEALPAEHPERVLHFVINNFNFIVVAEGDPDYPTAVYRYSLDRSRYVLLQRLALGGPATGVTVFTLGSTIEKDTFIALTTDCSGVVCKGSPMVVIFKYFGGLFEPFQSLDGPRASNIQALQHGSGAVLVVTPNEGSLRFFQYSGWRFVQVSPRGLPSLKNYKSATVATVGDNCIIALTSGVKPDQLGTYFYRLHFEWKSPLKDYHASVNNWLKQSMQVSGVAPGVMRLVEAVPHSGGTEVSFSGSITVRGEVTIANSPIVANKVFDSSRRQELPSTLKDSFTQLAVLNNKLRTLDYQMQQLVSLSSPEGWPRHLVTASSSVEEQSSILTASINGTINGHPLPLPSSLLPLRTTSTIKLPDLVFADVVAKGGISTNYLNGQAWSSFVTLQGTRIFKGNVTLSKGAFVSHITAKGRIGGHLLPNYLSSSSPQAITGELQCNSTVMKQLACDRINSVPVSRFLESAPTLDEDFILKGPLYVGGNITYNGSLNANDVHGKDIDEFKSSVLLKNSVFPQYVTGKHSYKNLTTSYLLVKDSLNNISSSDLYVNKKERTYEVPKSYFNSLTVDSIQINGAINEIKIVDGAMDVMTLKTTTQSVNGSKEFVKFHLSDIYQAEDVSSSPPLTTPLPPTTISKTVDEVAINKSMAITVIQEKLEDLIVLNKFLEDLPLFSVNVSASISPRFILACQKFREKFELDLLLKDLSTLKRMHNTLKDCIDLQRVIGSDSFFGKQILASRKLLYDQRNNIMFEAHKRLEMLGTELEKLQELPLTTVTPIETSFSSSNHEIARLNEVEHGLQSQLLHLKESLQILDGSKQLLEGRNLSSFLSEQRSEPFRGLTEISAIPTFRKLHESGNAVDTRAILLDISVKITDVSAEINVIENKLATVQRDLKLLKQANASVHRRKGPGSWVQGTVAGEDLAGMGALLHGMGPAASKRKEFIITNTSMISNIEFRGGLTVRFINGVDMFSVVDQLIPLTSSSLPMKVEFENETKVLGDFLTSAIDGVSAASLLTLNGRHTVPHHCTSQDTVHSGGNVLSTYFGEVQLNAETSSLARAGAGQPFHHKVSFRDVEARSVNGDRVKLAGVALEDVMTIDDNITVTGSFNFSTLNVLNGFIKVAELQTESVNSVNMQRLLSHTLRKTSTQPQVVTGAKTFSWLNTIGDLRTGGFTSQNPHQFPIGTVHNLTKLQTNVIRLDRGGTFGNLLSVWGPIRIKHLNVRGFLDRVKLPVNWLRSSGDQGFTAETVFITSLNAETVLTDLSEETGLLGRLVTHAGRTDRPNTFVHPVSFANLQVVRPLKVSGLVQGFSLPQDIVPSTVASVTLTGRKLLLAPVFATPNVHFSLNGVNVSKLCLMNNVVNVTVYGNVLFEKNLNVDSIHDGNLSLPLKNPGVYWRVNDNYTVHGEMIINSADVPAGVSTILLNGVAPKEAFKSRVLRSCQSLDTDYIWSFLNLNVYSATIKTIKSNLFQEVISHDLSSVLSTHGDQTITGIYEIHSTAVHRLNILGRINGVSHQSFCRRFAPCRVTASHSFEGDVRVFWNMDLLVNSTVQGVSLGSAVRHLAHKGHPVVVTGRTTVTGSLAVTGTVRSEALINGINFTKTAVLTKSDHRSISHGVIVSSSSSAPAISAFHLLADDGLFSNSSLHDLVQQSVLRGSGLSVVRGLTFFGGPVTFLNADSTYATPKIEPPEEIVRLKEDYARLQKTLKLQGKAVPAFLGWEEVQRIPGDWHSVLNVEGTETNSAPVLALLPWRGPAILLQQDAASGMYQDRGARLYGSCVADISGWRSSENSLRLFVSDACPGDQKEAPSGASATVEGITSPTPPRVLNFNELAVIASNVTQRLQVETTVFSLNKRLCIASVSASRTGVPIYCEVDDELIHVQTLPCDRPIKVSTASIDSKIVLVIASLGTDPYGGFLEFWIQDSSQDVFTAVERYSEPGVMWVSATSTDQGLLVATVSRHFVQHKAAVTVYRVMEDHTVTTLERLSVPRARRVLLLPQGSSNTMLVLTQDGALLRYTTLRDGRFVLAGSLQRTRVRGMTSWVQSQEARLAVVLETSKSKKLKGGFLLFKPVFSTTFEDLLE